MLISGLFTLFTESLLVKGLRAHGSLVYLFIYTLTKPSIILLHQSHSSKYRKCQ